MGGRHAYRKKEDVHGICPETYFRNLNVQFTCPGTMMIPEIKFRKPNMQFASSGIRMTPEAKFTEPNLHFTSSGTRMTQRDKFEGHWCILLKKHSTYQNPYPSMYAYKQHADIHSVQQFTPKKFP
jgi:hypothetical protein